MPVVGFEHINIRCADVERSRAFYVEILGLAAGDRPPFASLGYWLYLRGVPVVHLVQRTSGAADGSGAIDHIAFRGVDLEATRHALSGAGVAFTESVVPRDGTIQLFVTDPDGVKVELSFSGAGA